MCDMYYHGHYWETENEQYEIYMDFERNSHSSQREVPDLIPVGAIRCGADPINGKAIGQDGPLPKKVADTIEMMIVMNYPDRESLKTWIRHNFGSNNDREDWLKRMPGLIDDEHQTMIFTHEDWTKWAENWTKWAENCTKRAEFWTKQAEFWTKQAEDWTKQVEYCAKWAEYWTKQVVDCTKRVEYWTEQAEDACGEVSCDDIRWLEYFLDLFDRYPNAYWSSKTNMPNHTIHKSILQTV